MFTDWPGCLLRSLSSFLQPTHVVDMTCPICQPLIRSCFFEGPIGGEQHNCVTFLNQWKSSRFLFKKIWLAQVFLLKRNRIFLVANVACAWDNTGRTQDGILPFWRPLMIVCCVWPLFIVSKYFPLVFLLFPVFFLTCSFFLNKNSVVIFVVCFLALVLVVCFCWLCEHFGDVSLSFLFLRLIDTLVWRADFCLGCFGFFLCFF